MRMYVWRHNLFFIICCVMTFQTMLGSNASTSAFNEMLTVAPTPMVQLQFPYNIINTDYVTTTLTGSGTVSTSNPFATINSGAATSSSAILASRSRLHYQSGQGCSAIFTAIFTPQAGPISGYYLGVSGNSQIIGIGNAQDGFFFGFDPLSTNFGILFRNNSVDTWTFQFNWNGDVMNGTGASGITLNPTDGNVYKIQYQWLGFGVIKFYVENPVNSSWILVHTIQYPNANTSTSLVNPSLQLWAASANTTNNTNITLQTSSMAGMIEGATNQHLDTRNGYRTIVTVSTTSSFTNVVSIQNFSTFNSVNNQVLVYPDYLACMTTSGTAIITLYLNPTVGGSPLFKAYSNNSVVQVDSAGTTLTAATGKALFTCYCSAQFFTIDLSNLGITLVPGDILVVAAESTSGSVPIYFGISWRERF